MPLNTPGFHSVDARFGNSVETWFSLCGSQVWKQCGNLVFTVWKPGFNWLAKFDLKKCCSQWDGAFGPPLCGGAILFFDLLSVMSDQNLLI